MMYEYRAIIERVVDGDTLDLMVDLGFKVHARVRVRLAGIDTPEVYGVKKDSEEWLAGTAASDFAKEWARAHSYVILRSYDGNDIGTGKFGRWIGVVLSPDLTHSLNRDLVEAGHAMEVEW